MGAQGSSTCLFKGLSGALASPASASMVVLARLQYVREQIMNGAWVSIAALPGTHESRTKLRIQIRHGARAPMPEAQALLLAMVGSIEASVAITISVDRGHWHHQSNTSEIGVWLTPRPPLSRSLSRDGDDDDGPPSSGGGGPRSWHPRRGRSPPQD